LASRSKESASFRSRADKHDNPESRGGKDGGDLDEAVNVIGPAMQQKNRRSAGGARLGEPNIEAAGVDLFEWTE
jgi:hypothetical protein